MNKKEGEKHPLKMNLKTRIYLKFFLIMRDYFLHSVTTYVQFFIKTSKSKTFLNHDRFEADTQPTQLYTWVLL